MKVDTYECDVCRVQKKEANHWWLASDHVFSGHGSFAVYPWSEKDFVEKEWPDLPLIHMCGESCVQKKLAEFLAIK
jgi:hypothetical protein